MKIKAKWLRKCPFCGSRDVETKTSYEVSQSGLTMLLCFGCGATVSFQGKEQKHQAIAAWNRRAEPEAMELALVTNAELVQGYIDYFRQELIEIERDIDTVDHECTDNCKAHVQAAIDALTIYPKALEESVIDAACDESCPAGIYGWECSECKTCCVSAEGKGELYHDTDRDIRCWVRYYLEQACKPREVQG